MHYRTMEEAAKMFSTMNIREFDATEEEKNYIDSVHNNKSKFTQLSMMYKYLDKINLAYQNVSVCEKGCSHCCKIPVMISEIEAKYIQRNTQFQIKNNKSFNINSDCPLLDSLTGSCKVYEYRPISCRSYIVFDNPKYCEDKNTTHLHRTADSYNKNTREIIFNFILQNGNKINDIRYFFN